MLGGGCICSWTGSGIVTQTVMDRPGEAAVSWSFCNAVVTGMACLITGSSGHASCVPLLMALKNLGAE